VAPKAPYVIVGFDVDPDDPAHDEIIADVLAGFPSGLTPNPLPVENQYAIEVPSSSAFKDFLIVGTYLSFEAQEHNGALRWVAQLCRKDEFASS
jgi:hypothetical protein